MASWAGPGAATPVQVTAHSSPTTAGLGRGRLKIPAPKRPVLWWGTLMLFASHNDGKGQDLGVRSAPATYPRYCQLNRSSLRTLRVLHTTYHHCLPWTIHDRSATGCLPIDLCGTICCHASALSCVLPKRSFVSTFYKVSSFIARNRGCHLEFQQTSKESVVRNVLPVQEAKRESHFLVSGRPNATRRLT